MNEIKVKLNHYNLDLKNPDDKKKYQEIKSLCESLGYKLFDTWYTPGKSLTDQPDEQTIETDYLFENQYSTREGYRIFDWYEGNYPATYKTRKVGYYLTGDIDALTQAKENQLCCGFCGQRYDKTVTEYKFCNKCLSSEYLTEDNLHLLLLLPVSLKNPDRRSLVDCDALTEAWKSEHFKMLERLKLEKLARLKSKALKLKGDLNKKIEQERLDTSIKVILLEHGIDTENLIYYSHTQLWVFGWRNQLTESERQSILTELRKIEHLLPNLWIESLSWEMQRDARGFTI